MNCAFCHKELIEKKIYIRDECPQCGKDLHICFNCEFYDANAYRQCRESCKEPVHDKEKLNYCDLFRPAMSKIKQAGSENDVFRKLNDLFR
jgi:rRNA maturation protein Nop10